uniref:C6 domain-containing protein n=1 Tax=Panagrolaimus sp. PS1159 TaxID=55785 RepID=A0AC35GPE0_9BILA
MYLLVIIFVLQFIKTDECFATAPPNSAAPEIPIIPCQTCAAPAVTPIPAAAEATGDFRTGVGSVAAGEPVTEAMCKTFVITCQAEDNAVSIGPNDRTDAALAGPATGEELTATVVCNQDGVLEGQTVIPAGERIIIMSVYCTVSVP